MCGGGRREHHRKEEAKREANQRANEFAAQMEEAERRNQQVVEALKPGEQKYTPPPVAAGAMLGSVGIRPRKSRKAGTLGSRRGMAQLRIPLNVAQSATGGTNLPT